MAKEVPERGSLRPGSPSLFPLPQKGLVSHAPTSVLGQSRGWHGGRHSVKGCPCAHGALAVRARSRQLLVDVPSYSHSGFFLPRTL